MGGLNNGKDINKQMKIDLVKLVEEVYKLEGEPKNVNKVFALICLQAFKEQLTLTDINGKDINK